MLPVSGPMQIVLLQPQDGSSFSYRNTYMISRFCVDVWTYDASPGTQVRSYNALSKLKYFEGISTPKLKKSSQKFRSRRTNKMKSFKSVLDAPSMSCETKQRQIKDYFVRSLNGPMGDDALEDERL